MDAVNVAKYRTLAAAVELGSLTKAAERMGCTQSAVSHSIESLEKELGFSLIRRSRAGVSLTAEGEKLWPGVTGLLNSAERLSQLASSIRGLDSGLVRIGAFTSVAVHWLPSVLKEFQTDFPNVEFRLLNGDYNDVEQWLSDGSVDIGFWPYFRKIPALKAIPNSRLWSVRQSPLSAFCRAQTMMQGGHWKQQG